MKLQKRRRLRWKNILMCKIMHNRIGQLREEHHMTQVQLSIELDVSQETVSAYENGKHFPSVANLLKMSQIFDVSCDYLLGLSEQRKNFITSDLTDEEIKLLCSFGMLSTHQKQLVLSYIRGLSEQ